MLRARDSPRMGSHARLPGDPHALGPRVVPDLPGLPRAARRRGRSRCSSSCAADPAIASCSTGRRSRSRTTSRSVRRASPSCAARIAEGRIAIGPWYVQPDSLLPAGESHVRNLLEGRRAGEAFGPVSRIGVHARLVRPPRAVPAALRRLRARAPSSTGAATATRSTSCRRSTTGSRPTARALLACHLGKGYFAAATDPRADVGDVRGPRRRARRRSWPRARGAARSC